VITLIFSLDVCLNICLFGYFLDNLLLFMFLDICKFLTVDFIYFVYPVLLRHQGDIFNCVFSLLCLSFVLLRQKMRVFLFLDWDYIFKSVK
jgi:hypothetical protein